MLSVHVVCSVCFCRSKEQVMREQFHSNERDSLELHPEDERHQLGMTIS